MSLTPKSTTAASRIEWVDVAKALGIVLVFHGHVVQEFIPLRVGAAAHQMRWIYAFHMPMFFLLVGLVYKGRALAFDEFLRRQVRTRLVPAWIFNVVGMLIWIAVEQARGPDGWIQQHGWGAAVRTCGTQLLELLYQGRARENWNIVTWFLICLFTVELLQFGLRPLVKTTPRLIASLLGFAILSTLITTYSDQVHLLFPQRHWWYISGALMALVFYQLGMLLRRLGLLTGGGSTARRAILAAACLLITLATYNRNAGAGSNGSGVVMMVDARFGDAGWFFVTALAGAFFIVFTSQLLARSCWLQAIGRKTMTLMCLNGLLLAFVYPPLAKVTVAGGLADNVWEFTALALLYTVLSLALCIPLDTLLGRYVPWAIGRKPRPARTPAAETTPAAPA